MIEIEARIRKEHIVEAARYKGCIVADMIEDCDGNVYEPGTLCLLGFAGTHIGNHIFAGVYRFARVGPHEATDGSGTCRLSDLPTADGGGNMESDDGIHAHDPT